MPNIAPDAPSELGATQTRLSWSANTMEAANRVIATKGLLFYPGGGTGADLPIAGNVTKGITQLSAAPATVGSPIALSESDKRVIPTVSSTIPSNPVDGQLWLYTTSTNQAWLFRFNSGINSAYQWQFIGGGPVISNDATSQTISTTTSFAAITTAASVALPFAGEYECGIAASFRMLTAGRIVVHAPAIVSSGGSATVSANNGTAASTSSSSHWASVSRFDLLTNSAANATLKMYANADATVSVEYARHTVKALPVRVG